MNWKLKKFLTSLVFGVIVYVLVMLIAGANCAKCDKKIWGDKYVADGKPYHYNCKPVGIYK